MTQTAVSIINTTCPANGTVRGVLDMTGCVSAQVSSLIKNQATGPSAGCKLNVYIAHADAAPSAPAADGVLGAGWRLFRSFQNGTTANEELPISMTPTFAKFWCFEYTGNTGQPVNVLAEATKYAP